jgi:hypothetical protein
MCGRGLGWVVSCCSPFALGAQHALRPELEVVQLAVSTRMRGTGCMRAPGGGGVKLWSQPKRIQHAGRPSGLSCKWLHARSKYEGRSAA